jgi:ABC-type multidrug transport system fused ATPase/permease subunit
MKRSHLPCAPMKKLSSILTFLKKSYFLSRPYGLKRLAMVFMVMLGQGFFQVIGVTSIFPFLALASSPDLLRDSSIGARILSSLPPLSDNQLLVIAGCFATAMLLFSNAFMLAGEVIRVRYSQGFAHWLRLRLLRRMVTNPYAYFLRRNSGELLKKTVGDVTAYVSGVLSPLLEGLARLITVLFLLATLLLVDFKLALISAVGFGVFYFLFFYLLRSRRRATSAAMKMANRGAMREAQQLLGGIKPIKVHGAEAAFIERYAKHSFIQSTLFKWYPIYQNSPRYLIEPLAFGGVVILVVILAARGDDFISVLPTLGVMAIAGYRLIPNLQLLYGAATGISLMIHSLEEVYEEFAVAEEDSEVRDLPDPSANSAPLVWRDSVCFEKITFTYAGTSKAVLHNISLRIERQQFVAFIGQTGSGKSTLIDLLLGLHLPQSGKLLVDGNPLQPEQMRNWRAGIGYVPQEIFLLDDSITANIAFGVPDSAIDFEQVLRVAEVAQIRDFIETELPEGFATSVGERGVRLSGGQRQRIGLARALYRKPEMLVLDEATSALDNETEAALMQAIESLYGQITLVVIAHRLSTVERADRIFELSHGVVKREGTYKELELDKHPASTGGNRS